MPSGNFALIYNKERFINYSLAKEYYGVTDQQLMTFSMLNALETRVIMGKVFVKLTKQEFLKVIEAKECNIQDLDESLACLIAEKDINCKTVRDVLWLPKGTPYIMLENKKFAQLKYVNFNQKYNKLPKMPHIKVCGSLFVAIDCINCAKEGSYLIKIEEV